MWVVNFIDLFSVTMNVNVSTRSIYEFTEKNPHRSLYVAVIVQALLDVSRPKDKQESDEYKEIREEAHSWFFCSCRDFETICDYAGFEPMKIRKFALKVINLGEPEDARRKVVSSLIY